MTDSDEIEAFHEIQARLPELWSSIQRDPMLYHTNVIVPSLSFDQEELQKVAGVPFYEERLLFLLMRLRRPGARVIYVTSQPVDNDIVEYYLQLLVGVPASHAERRLEMLCLYDASPRALTEKVLERPRVLERLRRAIGDPSHAYLTAFCTTPLERRLAVELGIPLNGADPDLADLGTKSGSREVFRAAAVELPEGYERVRDRDHVVESLSDLARARPGLRRAVVKLDAGFSGEGNALFDYPQPLPDDEPARRAAIDKQLGKLGFAAASHRADEFFEKYAEMGGIVEEFFEASEVRSPSVQLRITPQRDLAVLSTHDQVLGGASGQVYVGCRFPAAAEYRAPIMERAMRIGEVLRDRGVIGRFAVDFLAVRDPGEEWRYAAIEINLRMGGTTFPFIALEFLTGGVLEDSGEFLSRRGNHKYYFATDTLTSSKYRGLLPVDFLDIVIQHGLHFRPSTETGVLFHMIGALSQFGKLGVICIGDSPEEAEELYRRTIEVLDCETGASNVDSGHLARLFDDLPQAMD